MSKLARECLYLLPFPWYFDNLKAEVKIEVSSGMGICISPLDLRLRALEEQLHPVNATQNSPLDLRQHAPEAKPPEFVFDLVNI